MTIYIFMNHRIRMKKPDGPVIVALDESRAGGVGAVREANEFVLWLDGVVIGRVKYDPAMLAACETHEVKAWLELDDKIVLQAMGAPAVASEKKPNQPVKV